MTSLYSRNANVEAAPMKDETILFNPLNNKFCVLNATAAFIWQALEQPQAAEQIAAGLTNHFANVGMEQAQRDVESALAELHGIDCVVVS